LSADLSAPPVTVLHAADTLHCPVDVWTFRPWFTSGACPLCGWRAEGVTVARPWVERVDAA
jgi:hypothetical protein